MLQGFLQSAPDTAATARVTRSRNGTVDAVGGGEYREAPLILPYGLCSLPPEGVEAALLKVDGVAAFLGIMSAPVGLQPGEVVLTSSGGARIVLKNSGEIELNGLLISRDGQILQGGNGV